jgi:hypothetical protein
VEIVAPTERADDVRWWLDEAVVYADDDDWECSSFVDDAVSE